MIEYFNEDCMAGMARYSDKYFDLAIVDPPYGIGANKMQLGNGKVVWGCQCWWTDESKAEAIIGGRKVVNVEVTDGRDN